MSERLSLVSAEPDAPLYERLDAECNRLAHQNFARKVVALMREAADVLRAREAHFVPQESSAKGKHWTTLQAEEAERTPIHARPYCHRHRTTMKWCGSWCCESCNPALRGGTTRLDTTPEAVWSTKRKPKNVSRS